jgi:hypothetical protein
LNCSNTRAHLGARVDSEAVTRIGTAEAPILLGVAMLTKSIRRVAGAVLILAGAGAPLNSTAAENVGLNIHPRVAQAPATVRVLATVERSIENRELRVTAESELYFRSSTVQLDGDQASRTHTFRFGSLPPGEYEIAAVVRTRDGDMKVARRQVTVVGGLQEP